MVNQLKNERPCHPNRHGDFTRMALTNREKRHIAVIGPKDDMDADEICDPLDEHDIEVVRCKNEGELLMEWSKMIQREDPDFVTGYNIFGFDFKYIYERAQVCFPCEKDAMRNMDPMIKMSYETISQYGIIKER